MVCTLPMLVCTLLGEKNCNNYYSILEELIAFMSTVVLEVTTSFALEVITRV